MHLLQPVIRIVAILLVAVFTILAVSSCQPIYKTRLPRFADSVKAAIEPQALRKWAVDILNKAKPDSFDIPLKDVPSSVRDLQSDGSPLQFASYQIGTSSKDTYIQLMWGGGFGHWGLDIGSASFERPDDDGFYIEWIPGIYFWHETQ